MNQKKLLIISDSPMWLDKSGRVNVYEATLREVEQLTHLFDRILWVGFNRKNYSFGNGRPSANSAIQFELLMESGGNSASSKVKSILLMPYYWFKILKLIWSADYIHTRGPCVPALLAILLSFVFPNKKYWNKYAGSWGHQPDFFYRLQKKLLLRASFSKVTINGIWPDQRPHILSFENPCFTKSELADANRIAVNKKIQPPYLICFAGRLEEAKGVGNLILAINKINRKDLLFKLILAGNGTLKSYYKELADSGTVHVEFAGALSREQLNEVYAQSHFMILPSQSEGFPKVLSEAAAFGCIPIVTDISALGQYIKNGINGFMMKDNLPDTIRETIDLALMRADLDLVSREACRIGDDFTYEEFIDRLQNEVFAFNTL